MASTYSTNLRLELIGTGEQQGTWGNTTNTNLGTLLEEAIGGYTSVTVSDVGDTTLTTANGAVDQARNMTLNLTGTISAARNVICPAIEKVYIVKNATTGGFPITFKVSGQTGVSIPNGGTYFVYVDGTDARRVTGSIASQDASGVAITGGTINVGDTQAPRSDLQMTATTDPTAVVVGSISGTTLTVTAVTSGTLAVGNRLTIAASGLDYNTYIVALGTGTGGTGTYTINNTTTLSSTTIYAFSSAYNTLTFYEKDTAVGANQSLGGIEWFGSDASTPGGGVKAYVAAISESTTPDSALVFGTSDNVASTQAVERMRIDSAGRVGIGVAGSGGDTFSVGKELTGSTTSVAVNNFGQIQSDVTANAILFNASASTEAASFTVNQLLHYRANQGTLGAGSSVSAQYGYAALSTLNGATNNYGFYAGNTAAVTSGKTAYGFYSDINTATGGGTTYGFYAAGTAPNRFSGDVTVFGSGGLGYSTGSGGTVTQATSKATGVTLNKTNGRITMNNAALAAGATATFTLTNSTIAVTDTIILSFAATIGSVETNYTLSVAAGVGNAIIAIKNVSSGSLSQAVAINFSVIKAVTS